MVRIAYFGTDGCPGHHVIPIRGKFTEEDIKVIESVDCDDFYKVFDVMRFKIAEFKGLRHCSIISQLAAYGIAHKNRSIQGFLTSKNRFLTREEASELVRNNNQEMVVDRNAIREQLYSEDLY